MWEILFSQNVLIGLVAMEEHWLPNSRNDEETCENVFESL